MIFQQFVDDSLGCASYLIGDEHTGEAVVVDPAYAIEQYLEESEHRGVEIRRVLETHNHADHVSGHGRLALDHGAAVAIHPDAGPEYGFEPLVDGQELEVGEVAIRVLHTPGHRPEHCCFAVADRSRAEVPWLVLTGDSLFIGDAARPDLAVEAREGAAGLYESLGRLLELPDGVEVYPGHVAGSLCGAGMSSKASSTIGFERRFNPALAFSDVAQFVADRLHASSPRPPNMDRIVALNRGPFVGAPKPFERLSSTDSATVLDVRQERQFADGHVPGAINVAVDSSSFPTRAAFMLEPDERIAVFAESQEQAERAAAGLQAVGFLDLAGYVTDGETPDRLEPLGLEELERLVDEGTVQILDVREKDERDAGYIPGSRHVPYRQIAAYADELRNGPVATICATGARASIAASALAREGIEARPVLGVGVDDWKAEGKPVVTFRRCGS
jgi:hydroxyacylglutathione hydrolase